LVEKDLPNREVAFDSENQPPIVCLMAPAKQILSSRLSTTMFKTPWKPSFNGKTLPPCALYQRVVDADAKPHYRDDVAWTRESLKDLLDAAPAVSVALWESVLAIWRLSQEEEDGSEVETWRSLVVAWLVRLRPLEASGNVG
jgi:hypothetical protein